MIATGTEQALRDALSDRTDVRVAQLFGSVARGTAGPRCDVDLAVLGLVDRLVLAADLTDTLGRDVNIISLVDPGVPMLEELIRDGVLVHEGVPGAGAVWRSRALAALETGRPWYQRMQRAWLRRVAERGV